MKKIIGCLLLLAPGIGTAQTSTEAYAYVSTLQPPAWVIHKAMRAALGASSPIPSGDTVITGPGARLHVALADGSLLKLGENTTLDLQSLRLQTAKQGDVLNGTLKLSGGSLRYTAQKQHPAIKNELILQIGNGISAQVSSADLWAGANPAEDRLLLIDGSVVATPASKPAVTMAQANTLYTAYRNSPAKSDGVSRMQEPRLLFMLTEMNDRLPALQSNGSYRMVLAVYPDEAKALERVSKYTSLGYPVELQRPGKGGVSGFRVILDGLSNEADAKAYATILIERLKLLKPQVEALTP